MADQQRIGAAQVLVTIDDLAVLLGLHNGYRIEAVRLIPEQYRPGVMVAIVGPGLPTHYTGNALQAIDLGRFRQFVETYEPPVQLHSAVPRGTAHALDVCPRRCGGLLRLRTEGLRCDKCGADENGLGFAPIDRYTPARPIVQASDPERWPAFPGEELHRQNLIPDAPAESRGDPGDEDIHTGGPRL